MQHYNDQLREIFTRAVVARGEKNYRQSHVLIAEYEPEAILGYTCKNHIYSATPGPSSVEVKGKYDVHIWYAFSHGAQTAVMKESIHYTDYISVQNIDSSRVGHNEHAEIIIVNNPAAVDAYVKQDQEICVVVEMSYKAQVIGDARLWVKVYSSPNEAKDKTNEDEEAYGFDFCDMEELELEEPAFDKVL